MVKVFLGKIVIIDSLVLFLRRGSSPPTLCFIIPWIGVFCTGLQVYFIFYLRRLATIGGSTMAIPIELAVRPDIDLLLF